MATADLRAIQRTLNQLVKSIDRLHQNVADIQRRVKETEYLVKDLKQRGYKVDQKLAGVEKQLEEDS